MLAWDWDAVLPAQTSELGGVTTHQQQLPCDELRLHRPLSSEGLRRTVLFIRGQCCPAQTSELGGVTTETAVVFFYFHSLYRPLSSEGLRPIIHFKYISGLTCTDL